MPVRGRKIQHGDALAAHRPQESGKRPGVRLVVEHQRGAAGEGRQDLFEAGVPGQRRELQYPVVGGDAEDVPQRGDAGGDRSARRRDRFRGAGRAGREQDVRGSGRGRGGGVEHVPLPLGRERGVDRQVRPAGRPDAEQLDDRLRAVGNPDGHGARRVTESVFGVADGGRELRIGELRAVVHDRRTIRLAVGQFQNDAGFRHAGRVAPATPDSLRILYGSALPRSSFATTSGK